MNINTVIIGGNLVATPEVKFLQSGTAAGEFSIAVNETWKNEAGERQERAHFIRCFCFGKTAENIAKYFTKGQRIIVEGSLSQESWEDKETGKKREKTRVKVMEFHFVEKAGKKEGEPATTGKPASDDSAGDDIPF